jgi:hypothetical protein
LTRSSTIALVERIDVDFLLSGDALPYYSGKHRTDDRCGGIARRRGLDYRFCAKASFDSKPGPREHSSQN